MAGINAAGGENFAELVGDYTAPPGRGSALITAVGAQRENSAALNWLLCSASRVGHGAKRTIPFLQCRIPSKGSGGGAQSALLS